MTCLDCGRRISRRHTRCGRCFMLHRHGWGWEPDPVVVDRLIDGIPVQSIAPERAAAVRILTSRGLSAAAIAERVRITERSVVRWRARSAS